MFGLGIRKNFFVERVVKNQNKQPREVEESEVFKRCRDVAIRDMIYRWDWIAEVDDLT